MSAEPPPALPAVRAHSREEHFPNQNLFITLLLQGIWTHTPPPQLLPVSHEERPICLPADAPISTWPVAFLLSLALCASCQSNSPGLHPPVLTCTSCPSSLAPWSIFLALRADPPPPPIPSLSFLSRIVSEHL